MLVRPARAADAEAIRQIYNAAVETPFTFDLRPRTLAEQEAWLAQRSGAYATIVAVDSAVLGAPGAPGPAGGQTVDEQRLVEQRFVEQRFVEQDVVGFASLSPYRERPAYSTTVENSVYVREDQRGRGVGKLLLTELIALAEGHGFHAVMARIVGQNEASIALHRSVGFEHVGVEREVGRKFRRWLDVVAMQKLFTDHPTPAPADD